MINRKTMQLFIAYFQLNSHEEFGIQRTFYSLFPFCTAHQAMVPITCPGASDFILINHH